MTPTRRAALVILAAGPINAVAFARAMWPADTTVRSPTTTEDSADEMRRTAATFLRKIVRDGEAAVVTEGKRRGAGTVWAITDVGREALRRDGGP